MYEIKYEPMGSVRFTPFQKKEATIKRLKHWVAVLAVADALYTVLVLAMLYGMVIK